MVKKLSFLFLVIAAVIAFTAAGLSSLQAVREEYGLPADIANAAAQTEPPSEGFTIRLEGRRLCVYDCGGRLYRSYEIAPNTLSDYDRELLSEGISVPTEERMRSIIEDYTS